MAPKLSVAHSAWAGGHAIVILATIYCLIGLITLNYHPQVYKLAYAGATISWGIVCYKSLGIPQLSHSWISKSLMDENVQYLCLSIFWYTQPPIYVTMLPFATFSLFHALTFLRTNVLPKPPATEKSTSAASAPTPSQVVAKNLQVWIKANYETAMLFVSYVETIVVMGRLLLGIFLFFTQWRVSIMAPIFYAHFLRLRYYLSPQTRAAIATVSTYIDGLIANPSVPQPLKKLLEVGRSLVIRYANSVINLQQAAPPNSS